MANPKITLSLDQSILDTLNNLTAAINRLSDTIPAAPAQNAVSNAADPVAPAVTIAPATPVAPEIPVCPFPTMTVAQTAPTQMSASVAAGTATNIPISNPAPQPVVTQQSFAVPTAEAATREAPQITQEMIMRAGVELMSKGVNAATALMEMGVQSVSELKPEQYPAMAERLRQMGANI